MQGRGDWILLPENSAAAQAVERVRVCLSQRSKRRAINPLFLHGPPGSGKSRLVTELVDRAGRDVPDLLARSFPAADLSSLEDDVRTLSGIDLLAVEDVQHLPSSRNEDFVRLIDRGLVRQQQLVFTASAGPALLTSLPARITSRLASGLVVALAPLLPQSREVYLRQRCQERHLRVEDDVVTTLAHRLPASVRQLDAALSQLLRLATERGRMIRVDDITGIVGEQTVSSPTMERIVQQVGRYYQVEPRHLRSTSRSRSVMLPRQVGMYLARRLTELSLEQIGAYFGGRDHSTVLHACRKVEDALTDDAGLRGAVSRLSAELS